MWEPQLPHPQDGEITQPTFPGCYEDQTAAAASLNKAMALPRSPQSSREVCGATLCPHFQSRKQLSLIGLGGG